jgi:hypothetical protein
VSIDKACRDIRIVEKNKSRRGVENSRERRCVDYSTGGYKVIVAFIIIFGMCRKEGV